MKSTRIPALRLALAVVTAAIWQGIKVQHPDSLALKKPFPERNLLPSVLSRCGVGDQKGWPRHASLGDTDSMRVTCAAGSCRCPGHRPSFCLSLDSPCAASTGCTGGTRRGFKKKKKPLVKITRESPHTKAGNSSENTSHAGSEGPAWRGGASPC